jgi:uncharacterized RDD family membrane protein YckC
MTQETVPADLGRRGIAFLLEAVFFWVTLCVGWYVWLLFTSQRGTTPAKRVLGLSIFDVRSGRVASAGQVWLREVVYKGLLPGAVTLVAMQILGTAIAGAIPAVYLLAGLLYPAVAQDSRTTWDYLAGTEVRRQLTNGEPLTQTEMRRIDEALPSRNSFVR